MAAESMIERVARAIYEASPFSQADGAYEDQSETYRRMCRLFARAAIEAMREPTDEMMAALTAQMAIQGGYGVDTSPWAAAIDTALNEQEQGS